jgi:LCP family protein required for cell wall assembly
LAPDDPEPPETPEPPEISPDFSDRTPHQVPDAAPTPPSEDVAAALEPPLDVPADPDTPPSEDVAALEPPRDVPADPDALPDAPLDASPDGPPDAADILDGTARSRADLQTELRKSRKKERKRQHRWRRRLIYALSAIVLLGALGAGGVYYYAKYRYDEIKKVHAKHLVAQSSDPMQPFNILMVGSDSRAFVGDNETLTSELGNEANAGGQRSDVTMVARFDPANKTVTILSIPRDLWVNIPGNVPNISGMNRINAAYDSGPDLLIQTIETDLGIQINHYVDVNFPGFTSMVNALGGITMDFPTAVKDAYTGLDVTQTGCQVVNGVTALQLVRSRHLYYMNSHGEWEYDGLSDFSRIQRQDAFFRAVLQKANSSITNPLAINSFIGASVGNVTIDDSLTEADLYDLATTFRGLSGSNLVTETLPTTSFVTDGGADVLQEAQPYAQNMITAFNAIGASPTATPVATTKGKGAATSTTTTTTLPHRQVSVDVLNASTANGVAHLVAGALATGGFTIDEIGDASTPLTGSSSEILYGPAATQSAQTLAADLSGPVTLVPDSSLTGTTVQLLVDGTSLKVGSSGTSGSSGNTGNSGAATTTTTPTTTPVVVNGTTTTTTIPGDVYTNTQLEPWNPYPCTLGASTQAAPTTTTTTAKGKAKTSTTK